MGNQMEINIFVDGRACRGISLPVELWQREAFQHTTHDWRYQRCPERRTVQMDTHTHPIHGGEGRRQLEATGHGIEDGPEAYS